MPAHSIADQAVCKCGILNPIYHYEGMGSVSFKDLTPGYCSITGWFESSCECGNVVRVSYKNETRVANYMFDYTWEAYKDSYYALFHKFIPRLRRLMLGGTEDVYPPTVVDLPIEVAPLSGHGRKTPGL